SYDKMYKLLSAYLKKIGVDHYFYCFDPKIDEDFKIVDDIIYFKGEESFIPGILDKTLKVFEMFKNSDYNYIVRSNISAIINFKFLKNYLYYNPMDYGGPYNYVGTFLDPKSGLTEEKHKIYKNSPFIGGACIVMSV